MAVSLALARSSFPADAQPEFIVRFKNVGAEPRNLYDVASYWNWTIDLANAAPHAASPGPWRLQMHAIRDRHHIEHRRIEPGEGTEVAVSLNDPPFTFDYTYAGPMKELIPPLRHLHPGRYRLTVTVALTNPFDGDRAQWSGPVTTDPIELTITEAPPQAATKQTLAAYDAAIERVTGKLQPGGLWTNGGFPAIDLPRDAATEDVIDAAVNLTSLDSKGYRVLRVQPFAREQMPDKVAGSAALLRVGKGYKVVIVFPLGKSGWWSRFYDTDVVAGK